MRQERDRQGPEPRGFVLGLLGDRDRLTILLNDEKNPYLLGQVREAFNSYSIEETTQLTHTLLEGIGSYDDILWDVDRRDGALKLLEQIPFGQIKVKPRTLMSIYLRTLRNQGNSLDPLGHADSLLDAGIILAPHLPKTVRTKRDFASVLRKTEENLQDVPGIDEAKAKIEALRKYLTSPEDKEKTGNRTHSVEDSLTDAFEQIIVRLPHWPHHTRDKEKDTKPKEESLDANTASSNRYTRAMQPERQWDPETSESDLVNAAKKGDRGAFSELGRRSSADIYTLAYRLTGNEDDAHDVMQDAYLRAFRSMRRFRADAKFSTWMYRITANCATDKLKVRGKHRHDDMPPPHKEPLEKRPEVHPEAVAEVGSIRGHMIDDLAQLPPRLRLIVVLKDVYDLPHETIAESLGISEANSKVLLYRARRILKKRMPSMPTEE